TQPSQIPGMHIAEGDHHRHGFEKPVAREDLVKVSHPALSEACAVTADPASVGGPAILAVGLGTKGFPDNLGCLSLDLIQHGPARHVIKTCVRRETVHVLDHSFP